MLKFTHGVSSAEQEDAMPVVTPQEAETHRSQLSSSETKSRVNFEQVCAHLANERTFLTWIWTGIVLMAFGILVAKMHIAIPEFSLLPGATSASHGNFEISSEMIGILFLIIGLFTILMSAYRYLAVQHQLRKQRYCHADNYVLVFLLLLMLSSITVLILISQLR